MFRHQGQLYGVAVPAQDPGAADAEIFLGKLGLLVALAEGLQDLQLFHQPLGNILQGHGHVDPDLGDKVLGL